MTGPGEGTPTPGESGEKGTAAAGLAPVLEAALNRFAETPRILVALDFDGTLAPIVDDPMSARALPESAAAIAELRGLPDTTVALVSGRDLASLDALYPDSAGILIVASHGGEYRLGEDAGPEPTEAERARVAALVQALERGAAGIAGAWVEPKPLGAAVHTRLAEQVSVPALHGAVRAWVRANDPELSERTGKDVLEFSILSATKGDGIARLRAHTGADAVFYAGDDVTDEDAFAALESGDFGLKCGPGETRAEHRVAGPHEVALVLRALARARASRAYAKTVTN
ncbi:trehalose-phosphatase [Mycetocola saprophilus]|uniref:trehalose-phosphatase n=1 Tax=Mycetocola saprophilus TaxID=76636 RepID=UPI0006923D74|nr:trehalose-phosphatase [Mycetocola saprophilus]